MEPAKHTPTTRYYGKAEQAAGKITAAFEAGDVPRALAQVFINKRSEDIPCNSWSWNNQLLVALNGYSDARGYRQWQQVNRHVKKGEKAFPILAPRIIRKTNEETGELEPHVIGFLSVAVFGYEQTDGAPLDTVDADLDAWLESLPLRQVAQSWHLTIGTYSGKESKPLGWYRHRKAIAVGVKNLSTWAHELCHAADHRNLGSGFVGDRKIDKEIVAEFGGTVLLELLGYRTESDRGGCWDYIQHYAKQAKINPLTAISRLLDRTCQAVSLILQTAEALNASPVAVPAA